MTPATILLCCAFAWLVLSLVWLRTLARQQQTPSFTDKTVRLQVWLSFAILEIAVAAIGQVSVAVIALSILVAAGCIEIAKASQESLCVLAGVALAVPSSLAEGAHVAMLMAAVAAGVFLLPYSNGTSGRRAATVLLGLYVGLAPAALYAYRERPGLLLAVVLTLTGSHLLDILSGFVGKGGHFRPLPRLSPNKTARGFAMGAAIGAPIGIMLMAFIGALAHAPGKPRPDTGIFWLSGLGFGLALWAATALGDLVGSKVKRILRVKDYGISLGPHGGFMDRLDAFVPAVMIGCLAVT
ncbi:MAG: CDP-diglyceride synthetase [Massilia sp.]|nr:CDP-diglyceride synthetase [Massilia sp.]